GRLVDVKGRAMVPGEPEFGVSEHVATVLLAAREAGAPVRGAVNLRYDPETVDALAADHPTVEFDAERPTREAVADAVAAADPPAGGETQTLVLYQTGAVGVEPIVYVLAPTAAEAARIVRDLL
ncbi:DNA-binding protein, partial [Halorubrum distributum]